MVLEGRTKQVCVTGAHRNWTGRCSSNLRWSWRSRRTWNDTWAESFNNLSLSTLTTARKSWMLSSGTLMTDSGCWVRKVVRESIQINKCGNTEHLHDMCNTILAGFCKFLFGWLKQKITETFPTFSSGAIPSAWLSTHGVWIWKSILQGPRRLKTSCENKTQQTCRKLHLSGSKQFVELLYVSDCIICICTILINSVHLHAYSSLFTLRAPHFHENLLGGCRGAGRTSQVPGL